MGIKLTVGAWANKVPGTIGIGLQQGPACDKLLNAMHLDEEYEECSISEIYTYDMIEHISTKQIIPMFKVWYKILEIGGRLEIGTIDLEGTCRQFLAGDLKKREILINHFYGSQAFPTDYHYTGYTLEILTKYLTLAGFKDIKPCKAKGLCGGLQVEAFK